MPLKVIGAGLGRTGTRSLKQALEILGFGPCYHGFNEFSHPNIVEAGFDAAQGKQVDWSKAFGNEFESAVDFPIAFVYKHLIAAYPNAKIILTVRDPDSWYESNYEAFIKDYTEGLDTSHLPDNFHALMQKKSWLHHNFYNGDMKDKEVAMNAFRHHIEDVKATVPESQLLIFNIKQGWQPLCSFLGVEIPDYPFPRANDRKSMKAKMTRMIETGDTSTWHLDE